MKKKAIIVTGTSKGIGKYLRDHLLRQNYIVIGSSRKEIDFEHPNYIHYKMDIGKVDEVLLFTKWLKEKDFNVYGLINNAGVASMNSFLFTPITDFEELLNTNFKGTFLLCKEISKLMIKNKVGRIINFGTVAVPLALEGESIYVASKSAVISFTKVIARELSSYNITCNVISPGPLSTDLIKSVPEKKIKDLLNNLAIKKLTQLEDISYLVDFYLNEKSKMITGQTINTGGI